MQRLFYPTIPLSKTTDFERNVTGNERLVARVCFSERCTGWRKPPLKNNPAKKQWLGWAASFLAWGSRSLAPEPRNCCLKVWVLRAHDHDQFARGGAIFNQGLAFLQGFNHSSGHSFDLGALKVVKHRDRCKELVTEIVVWENTVPKNTLFALIWRTCVLDANDESASVSTKSVLHF